MADLEYVVSVSLETKNALGDLGAKIGDAEGKLAKAGASARAFGVQVRDAFTGAVEKVGSLAIGAAKIGAAAGFGAAVYGVASLNNNLEQTQTSIAAVLSAQGEVGNIGAGLDKAGNLVAQMREDAKSLPGEFSDLVGIFQSGIAAAGNAGIDSIKFEKMSAQAMAAAKAMQVPMDQAGRELAQLLEGRAGAHNVFGTRLGIKAKGFNEKSEEERVARITAALGAYAPAIKQFGGTFDALFSSAIDNVKQFGEHATKPLFGKVKETLVSINNWFDENKGQVSTWANQIGRFLGDAFDFGKVAILEWWPAISAFASNAYTKIAEIWREIGPTVASVGESIRDALKDPGTIDKIIQLLELYLAVKAGGAISSLAGGLGGVAGMGAIGTVAITAGAVAIGGVALNEAMLPKERNDSFNDVQTGNSRLDSVLNLFFSRTLEAGDAARVLSEQHQRLTEVGEQLGFASTQYQATLEYLESTGDELGVALLSAAAAAHNAASSLDALGARGIGQVQHDEITAAANSYIGLMNTSGVAGKIADAARGKKEKTGAGGGGGGAQKVEITINSNQAPGQISRAVVDEIINRTRHPRSSVHVRNFSSLTRG